MIEACRIQRFFKPTMQYVFRRPVFLQVVVKNTPFLKLLESQPTGEIKKIKNVQLNHFLKKQDCCTLKFAGLLFCRLQFCRWVFLGGGGSREEKVELNVLQDTSRREERGREKRYCSFLVYLDSELVSVLNLALFRGGSGGVGVRYG